MLKKQAHQKSQKSNIFAYSTALWYSNSGKEMWIQDQKEKIAEPIAKECTFKPRINKKFPKMKNKLKAKYNEKFNKLYQKTKENRRQRSQDKNIIDIEYDQQKEHCTFKPKILKRKPIEEHKIIKHLKNSHSENNPEITSNFKNQTNEDLKYMNKQIEGIEFERRYLTTRDARLK